MKGPRGCVHNLLHTWKANLVCLQETKLEAVTRGLIQSLWCGWYVDWLCLDFMGLSGGIILMWDTRVLEKVEEVVGRFSVSCRFKEVSGFVWGFTGVYGPQGDIERRMTWEELTGVYTWRDVPWCVGGDFNIVLYPTERVGTNRISSSM